MKRLLALIGLVVLWAGILLIWAGAASAHYAPAKPEPYRTMTLKEKHRYFHRLEAHARHGQPRRWHRKALRRIRVELRQVHAALRPKQPTWAFWRATQIWLAQRIAPLHRDAWPNCPDPYAGGGSWEDTARCEAKGTYESIGQRAWGVDPPGFYRCTLQFQPGPYGWEAKYAGELQRRFGVRKVCP